MPPTNSQPPIVAVLLSGGGRTMAHLDQSTRDGALRAVIGVVIASRDCPGARLARERGLPTLIVPGVIEGATLGRILRDHGAGWAALAGYLRLVRVPEGFEHRILNIHPALLPSFGGKGMYGRHVHQAVLDAGCRVSGCTVHLVDEAFDRGPILAQAACQVQEGDTADSLAARVFALECDLYPATLSRVLAGRIEVRGRRARIVGSP